MKRSGLTLIEIIVSLAVFSILLIGVVSIFGSASLNIGANGVSINSINDAKSELDIAIYTPDYIGVDNTVSETLETVDVLGTPVEVRKISSVIQDVTGHGNSSYESSLFTYALPVVGEDDGFEAFIDRNGNEIFDNTDVNISGSEMKSGYTYLAPGNLVLRPTTAYLPTYDINININGDVIIKNGATVQTTGDINITCEDLYIESAVVQTDGWFIVDCDNAYFDYGTVIAKNDVEINANEEVSIINQSHIQSINEGLLFKAKYAILNGTQSQDTKMYSNTGVVFELAPSGCFRLGDRNISTNDAFIDFKGGEYDGYAFNKNDVRYDNINYIDGQISNDDELYFK